MAFLNGYYNSHVPNHPRATSGGMVYDHILSAEKKLGRYLKPNEVVHHIDHNRGNNTESNLLVFATISDHSAFHVCGEYYLDKDGIAHCDKRKEYICTKCGTTITAKAKMCSSCSTHSRIKNIENIGKAGFRKTIWPDRDTLKDLIKTQSFLSIGRKFGVSDNTIRKWCKAYNLPHKPRKIKTMSDDEWREL